MLSKFAAICAIALAGAHATEIEAEAENWGGHGGYGAPRQSYRYDEPDYGYGGYGYGGHGGYGQSYGAKWTRVSTIRPRDVTAVNEDPVDKYYLTAPSPDEEIIASCEFDFLGYSESEGRLELRQKPNDLVSFIGEFHGLKPGLHALKIHEFGDLEYGCESTGDVFNPFGAYRGDSHEDIYERRVGDLEQVQARFSQEAEYKVRDLLATMSGPNSILGRSLVIYEREDDHDQTEHPATPTREGRYREGEGARIGCCVIGLAKGEKPKKPAMATSPQKLPKHPHH